MDVQLHASQLYAGSADGPDGGGAGVAGLLGYYEGWHLA